MKIIYTDILMKINYRSQERLVPITSESCASTRKEIVLGVAAHSSSPRNWEAKAGGLL